MSAIGLYTQRELDPLLGYAKKRERLEGKLLPKGVRVESFGQTAVLFPELAVAGLLARPEEDADMELVGVLRDACDELMREDSFLELSAAVRHALNGRSGWTLHDVVVAMVEHATDALVSWHECLWAVEQRLDDLGIAVQAHLGRVVDASSEGFEIELPSVGRRLRASRNATRALLPAGTWVALDAVRLGARAGQFLVPSVGPDAFPQMKSLTAAREEAVWQQMITTWDSPPVVVPRYEPPAAEEHDGLIATMDDEFAVTVDPRLYAGASTMRSHVPPAVAG